MAKKNKSRGTPLLPFTELDRASKDHLKLAKVQEEAGDMGVEWYLSRKRPDGKTRGEKMADLQDFVNKKEKPSEQVYTSEYYGGYSAEYDPKTGKRKKQKDN